jgi:signal peptidase II
MKFSWQFLFWFLLIIGIDQLTKWFFRSNLSEGEYWHVIPGILEFTLVYNQGIAFGLMQGAGIWLSPLAILVAIVTYFAFIRSQKDERLFRVGMVLLASGAIGNLIDRLTNDGKVTDFVDMKFIHVFNVADACITVAAAMIVVQWITSLGSRPSDVTDAGSSGSV